MACHLASSSSDSVENEAPFTYEKGFRCLRRLGSGGFGVVNESQRISDEQIFAIKRTDLPEDLNKQDKVLREVVLCKGLNHPHIVKYHNHWTETYDAKETNGPDIWKKSNEYDFPSEDSDSSGSNEGSEDQSGSEHDNNGSSEGYPFGTGYSREVTRTVSSSLGIEFVNFSLNTTRRAESVASGTNSKKKKKSYKPERSYLFIQMELCSEVNLKDWLLRTDTRSRHMVTWFLFQITSALKYIHERWLMHRDLKPGNIFFSKEDVLKVGDFGFVKQFAPPPASLDNGSQESNYEHSPCVGSELYQAVEQRDRTSGRYNNKVDIYALGVIWVEMLCFFSTQTERFEVLTALRGRVFPENFAVNYPREYNLLMEMLSPDPIQRPNAMDIMIRLLDIYPYMAADQSIQDLMK